MPLQQSLCRLLIQRCETKSEDVCNNDTSPFFKRGIRFFLEVLRYFFRNMLNNLRSWSNIRHVYTLISAGDVCIRMVQVCGDLLKTSNVQIHIIHVKETLK